MKGDHIRMCFAIAGIFTGMSSLLLGVDALKICAINCGDTTLCVLVGLVGFLLCGLLLLMSFALVSDPTIEPKQKGAK